MNLNFSPIMSLWLLVPLLLFVNGFIIYTIAGLKKQKKPIKIWVNRLIIFILIVIISFRPSFSTPQTVTKLATQYDIVFIIDTTTSMAVKDYDETGEVSRLDGAKKVAKRIAEEYSGSRFAIITSGSVSMVKLPFSYDSSAISSAIEVLKAEAYDEYNVGSDTRITASDLYSLLEPSDEDTSTDSENRIRLVYYIGDGEDTSNSNSEYSFNDSAQYIDDGAVIAVGSTAGSPVPKIELTEEGYIEEGTIDGSSSAVDLSNLKSIQNELGVPSLVNTYEGETVSKTTIESKTLYVEDTNKSVDVSFETYWIFGIVALLLIMVEILYATKQWMFVIRERK